MAYRLNHQLKGNTLLSAKSETLINKNIDGNAGVKANRESNAIKIFALMIEELTAKLVKILSELIVALDFLVAFELLREGEQFLEESINVVSVVGELHLLLRALLDHFKRNLFSVPAEEG